MENFQIRKNIIEISDTIPSFVRDSYPRFIEFIETYFEFLESSENYLDILERFNYNINLDFAEDVYLDKLAKELGFIDLSDVRNLFLDKKILIRFIDEFNSTRGSANSYKLLYRLLFNLECKIKYPKDQLFYLSNSNYIKKHYVIVSTNNIKNVSGYTTKAFSGNFIEGEQRSFSITSQIESISFFIHNGIKYAKLEIVKPNKQFFKNEIVYLTINGKEYIESVQSIIDFNIIDGGYNYSEGDKIQLETVGTAIITDVSTGSMETVTINSGGINYKIGDTIVINKSTTNLGYGFKAVVKTVSNSGSIESIVIIDNGYNYNYSSFNNSKLIYKTQNGSGADITISSTQIGRITGIRITDEFINAEDDEIITIETSTGSGASLSIVKVTNHDERGFYRNNINVLGVGLKLQNSANHLHSKSYTIQSEIGSNFTDNIIKENLHTAGIYRHYEFLIKELITDEYNLYLSPSYVIKILNILSQLDYYELQQSFKLIKYINYIINEHVQNQFNNLDFYKFSDNFKFNPSRYSNYTIEEVNTNSYYIDGLDAEIKFLPRLNIIIEMPIINIKILNRIDNVSFWENRIHFEYKNVINNYPEKSDIIYNNLQDLSISKYRNYNNYAVVSFASIITPYLLLTFSDVLLLNDNGYFTDALEAEFTRSIDGNVVPAFLLW